MKLTKIMFSLPSGRPGQGAEQLRDEVPRMVSLSVSMALKLIFNFQVRLALPRAQQTHSGSSGVCKGNPLANELIKLFIKYICRL